jgi:hypothetical protein
LFFFKVIVVNHGGCQGCFKKYYEIFEAKLSHVAFLNEGFISYKGVDGCGRWHNFETSTIRDMSYYMD